MNEVVRYHTELKGAAVTCDVARSETKKVMILISEEGMFGG